MSDSPFPRGTIAKARALVCGADFVALSCPVATKEQRMAQLVAGIGVPHSPHYPAQYAKDGPEETPRLFRELAAHLAATRPDAIVVIANDHFNTFFMNNFPTFAIGVAEATFGPNDQTKMPRYDLKVQASLAAHIRNVGVAQGFDFAVTQEFGIDHAMLVPLHYLTNVTAPVVPIWVNAFVAPLPTARRCYALGEMVRSAIESWPQNLRVAAIGTGSFSLEIGGPKIRPGKRNAVPDLAWAHQIQRRIGAVEIDALIDEATPERMWRAGNIGGELLNWMVTLGVVGKHKPRFSTGQGDDGHSFVVWRWD
jgi:protocatechuate 4,5-dioxygenase beta chain